MNIEKQKELIDYLASLGFTGDTFTEELKRKISLNTPGFRLDNTVSYDGKRMLCELNFKRDPQFDAYRLESYEATLREAPEFEHSVINGIDTERLEQRFKAVNWDQYFNDTKGLLAESERHVIKGLIDEMWQLTTPPSEEGGQLQGLLQYHYWPEHAWDDAARDLQPTYDWSRTFDATEFGICNTNLAYNLLSGRLEDLHEKLGPLRLDQLPGADTYRDLERILSNNPKEFALQYHLNGRDGYGEYTIPIHLDDRWFVVGDYALTLTPHPPIEHGVFNGIDSAALEAKMQAVDWSDDYKLFEFKDDSEPEFTDPVNEIVVMIHELRATGERGDIADQLMLKYWPGVTFFDGMMIDDSAWDLLDTLPKRQQQFTNDITVQSAYNLLAGRAVLNQSLSNVNANADTWMRLDLSTKDTIGQHPSVYFTGYPVRDMEEQLRLLPRGERNFYNIRNSILQGDQTAIPVGGSNREVLCNAVPEERTLAIYTKDLRPIPFNFNLDPDWKPQMDLSFNQSQEKSRETRHQKLLMQGRNPKNHKGPKL